MRVRGVARTPSGVTVSTACFACNAQAIAARWGRLDGMRQLSGRPLGAPDGMIAATALEHDLTIVTRNVKDFAGLGVTIFNPWDAV